MIGLGQIEVEIAHDSASNHSSNFNPTSDHISLNETFESFDGKKSHLNISLCTEF